MKKTHSEPDVVYEEGDVTSMPYPNGAFDIVVDKGTKITLFFFCLTRHVKRKLSIRSHIYIFSVCVGINCEKKKQVIGN